MYGLSKKFQSTPLCEGRPFFSRSVTALSCFNPRPCARGDTGGRYEITGRNGVSIHAPVRGATRRCARLQAEKMFQSTPLCEGRPKCPITRDVDICFNPRPCARGDVLSHGWIWISTVSIHAPVRGATVSAMAYAAIRRCFNPRPCARGDTAKCTSPITDDVSIHAPVRGATRYHL